MKNYNYDFILPFFTSIDENRLALTQIHKDPDGYIYATNTHILVRIPSKKVGNQYDAVEHYPKAGNVLQEAYIRPHNLSRQISVDDLILVLSKAKWHKELRADKCTDCKGDGEIYCEACGHSHDCERCNGSGKINNRITEFTLLKESDYFLIKIGQQAFLASYLHILAVSAKIVGVNTIEFIFDESSSSGGIFRFGDVEILIMSCNSDNASALLKTKTTYK